MRRVSPGEGSGWHTCDPEPSPVVVRATWYPSSTDSHSYEYVNRNVNSVSVPVYVSVDDYLPEVADLMFGQTREYALRLMANTWYGSPPPTDWAARSAVSLADSWRDFWHTEDGARAVDMACDWHAHCANCGEGLPIALEDRP